MERPKHPNDRDLYTPITPQVMELFEQLERKYGTWRRVAFHVDTRLKVLRNIRRGRRKAVSMTVLDRIITGSGVGNLEDFPWFTADDLVALGIWKPPTVWGRPREVDKGEQPTGKST